MYETKSLKEKIINESGEIINEKEGWGGVWVFSCLVV
jgi:hypothetical protein